MREYAVAPIHASGVALRHVGSPGCNLSPALDLDVELLTLDSDLLSLFLVLLSRTRYQELTG